MTSRPIAILFWRGRASLISCPFQNVFQGAQKSVEALTINRGDRDFGAGNDRGHTNPIFGEESYFAEVLAWLLVSLSLLIVLNRVTDS